MTELKHLSLVRLEQCLVCQKADRETLVVEGHSQGGGKNEEGPIQTVASDQISRLSKRLQVCKNFRPLYDKLESRQGQKLIYKLAHSLVKAAQDINK